MKFKRGNAKGRPAERCPDLYRYECRSDVSGDTISIRSSRAIVIRPQVGHRYRYRKQDQAKPDNSRSDKIRLWRRRALSKRGARLHTKMAADAQSNSLAMLDETGVVVCWYGSAGWSRLRRGGSRGPSFVGVLCLRGSCKTTAAIVICVSAVIDGRLTRRAWRRRRDGSAYLGSFDIEPVVLPGRASAGVQLRWRASE